MLAVVLTGGLSRRMGRDKAMLPWGDKTMAQHLLERFRDAGFDTAVSVDVPGRFPLGIETRELPDAYPGQGPLNGLYGAFTSTDADTVLLLGTDMPEADPTLALYLETLRGEAEACMVRREDGRVEPLFGVYARSCLPRVAECLSQGKRSLRSALEGLRVRYVEERELPQWDLERILRNLNTPEAYEKYQPGQSREA